MPQPSTSILTLLLGASVLIHSVHTSNDGVARLPGMFNSSRHLYSHFQRNCSVLGYNSKLHRKRPGMLLTCNHSMERLPGIHAPLPLNHDGLNLIMASP